MDAIHIVALTMSFILVIVILLRIKTKLLNCDDNNRNDSNNNDIGEPNIFIVQESEMPEEDSFWHFEQ